MHLDAFLSMVVFTVATVAFYLLGASVLHQYTGPEGLPGTVSGMLQVLSQMYVPVLGERVALWFIVIGAFSVLFSSFFVSTATIGRTLTDFLKVNGFIQLAHPGRTGGGGFAASASRSRFCISSYLCGFPTQCSWSSLAGSARP